MPVPVIQRRMLLAAKRHGVTQDAFAAHLGLSSGYVSQFTVSGKQWREMSLSEVVALLDLAGEGEAAADILTAMSADFGVVVRSASEVEASADRLDAARETSEALSAVLHPATPDDVLVRECREAAQHLTLVADRVVAGK